MEGESAPADEPPAACEAAAEAIPHAPAPMRTGPSRSPLRTGARAARRFPAAGQARDQRSPAAAGQAPADEAPTACEAAAEAVPRVPAPLRMEPSRLPLRTGTTGVRVDRRSPAAPRLARGRRSTAAARPALGQAERGAAPRSPVAATTGPDLRALAPAAPRGSAAVAELPSGHAGADARAGRADVDAGGAARVKLPRPASCAQVAVSGGHGVDEEDSHVSGTDSLEGFDPDTSFLLKIKLLGNPKRRRKDMKCFSLEMTVDSDLTNYDDLVGSVVNKYPPGHMEVAHVQYYDEVLKIFLEITTDKQLMTMFSKHFKSKVINMFIAYCGPSDVFEPISEWDFDDERQPDDNSEQVNTEPVEDDYLKNPQPQNEHVGVDEENMYLDNEPVNCLAVVPSPDKGNRDSAYVPDDSEGGRPEDIAAMKAIKGEPKRRAKNNKSTESSILPLEEAPSASMSFPPRFPISYPLQCRTCCHFHFKPVIDSKFLPSDHSQSLETTAKKKRKADDCTPATSKSQSLEVSSNKKGKYGSSNSGASKRSRSGSNQPEALSIDFPAHKDQPGKAKAKKRVTFKTKKKELDKEKVKKPQVILDSPAMGTRSKASQPASPAMSTRSKRRISL